MGCKEQGSVSAHLSPCLSIGQKKKAEHPFIKDVELAEDDWYCFFR